MHLAEDRVQWWVLVNTVMNLRVPRKTGIYLSVVRLLILKSNVNWMGT
jgi:hypothetical protein